MASIRIEDTTIWLRHIEDEPLRTRLGGLRDEDVVHLVTDGVVGRWRRMKTGSDGRPTLGIKPEGEMKAIWLDWYRKRRGEFIELSEVRLADDYLAEGSRLFSEWSSPQDEQAFRYL